MKKLIALLLVLVLIIGLVACGETAPEDVEVPVSESKADENDKLSEVPTPENAVEDLSDSKIALYGLAPHPFFDAVKKGVDRWSEENNCDVLYQLGNAWTQDSMDTGVLALAAMGYEGIGCYPADASATNALYADLVSEGIDVANYACSTNEPTDASICFMTPMTQSAADALEWLINAIGGKGNIIVVIERVDDPNNILRLEGVDATLAKYPEITVLQQVWGMSTEAEAIAAIEPVFSSYAGQIDGIIALGGTASLGMQTVIAEYQESSGNDVVSIGIDDDEVTLKNIREGVLDATYAQNPAGMGYLTCQALAMMQDGWVPAEGVYTVSSGSVIVTKENIDTYAEELQAVTNQISEELYTTYMVKED